MADKQCSLCKTTKPLSDFHKDKNGKDGHVRLCKECANERRRQWQRDNKERAKARQRQYYLDNQERLRREKREWRKNNPEYMSKYMKKYYRENRESFLENCKRYYQENKEAINKRNREYGAKWREENKEENRKANLEWYYNNREKALAYKRDYDRKHREYRKEYFRLYRENNRPRLAAKQNMRRARKINATPKWADKELIELIYEECPDGHHVDHIVPLQGRHVCGLHVHSNLQYLPAIDNIRKSNRLEEF